MLVCVCGCVSFVLVKTAASAMPLLLLTSHALSLHAVLSNDIQEQSVLADSCLLLAAMFPHASQQQTEVQLDCLELVLTIAAGAAKRGHLQVACAASFAVAQMGAAIRAAPGMYEDNSVASVLGVRGLHVCLMLLSSFPPEVGTKSLFNAPQSYLASIVQHRNMCLGWDLLPCRQGLWSSVAWA